MVIAAREIHDGGGELENQTHLLQSDWADGLEIFSVLQEQVPPSAWEELTELSDQLSKAFNHRSSYASVQNGSATMITQEMFYGENDHSASKFRELAVFNLRCLKIFYSLSSDVLVSATFILDYVLSKVKVQPKYMSCLTAACFGIAADMHNHNRASLTPADLAYLHRRAWSPSDFVRMENRVMEKLQCDLRPPVTCLTFLHFFYRTLCLSDSDLSRHCSWDMLESKVEACLIYREYRLFRPCTLALSILDVALQDCCASINAMQVVGILFHLQSLCQVSDAELYECNEMVVNLLERYSRQGNRNCLKRNIIPSGFQRRFSLTRRPRLPSIPEEDPMIPASEGNDSSLSEFDGSDSSLKSDTNLRMNIQYQVQPSAAALSTSPLLTVL